ncbi:DUF4956 domain-containing protein [Arthrobacter agilis]|uniref:DUF4956 domain-containing protein n=1 Tax=Arthrobacter agilis TaxID=37921 RepID=A0A2L0UFL0_9MICC|nr:DUF4956 domain-containing protein [Arthrobacter agilis]AUZ88031.1 DUF4956 domain-containing protein [Arthrobacter agilis]
MNILILIAADLLAITLLTFGLYLRRHRRRDLVVSYLGMNVGVLAVATALSGSAAGVGLGLGLFGVLSIIRLRSTELAQHEVAYYFSALALGLIAGLGAEPLWLPLALMGLILAAMFIGDHSWVLPGYRHQIVVLDQAISDEAVLHTRLNETLNARIHSATVTELDLVNDKTIVEVRYEKTTPPQQSVAGPATPSITSLHDRASNTPAGTTHYTDLPETTPAGNPAHIPNHLPLSPQDREELPETTRHPVKVS